MGNEASSLHKAAAHNDVSKVESLFLHQHANVNDRDKDGWTPLHFASYGGGLEVTQALLLRGANPEALDKANRTPLHLAALQGHTTLASLLIGRGAHVEVKDENDMTPLHKASIKGHVDVGEQLLRLGADVNARVKDGTTSLHLAAWKNQPEFVKLLLSRGADVQAATNQGRTPLHEAAESGNTDIVQMLLSLGANRQAVDKCPRRSFPREELPMEGQNPASLASRAGHSEIVDIINKGSSGSYPAFSYTGSQPSAPPIPSGEPVRYPDIYQPKQSEQSAEDQFNKDFWNQNLDDKDKEKAQNSNFWGDALGDSKPAQPAKASPKNERQAEIARNKQFWDNQLGGGLNNVQSARQNWVDQVRNAQQAWDSQFEGRHGAQQQKHPREEFQDNLLKQAQGFWNMLQGKGQQQQQGQHTSPQADDGWGGSGAQKSQQGWGKSTVPSQEKYDLEPYDEDDYKPEASKQKPSRNAQDLAAAKQRVAELELQLDREQGWIRGGTKEEAAQVKARRDRIKEQESEIAQLKKQLGSDKVTFGGRTGGRDLYSAVPAEYLCPITQELMYDPVTAGDGYTYERKAIAQWINSGHNTSPMTGGHLPKQELTPNYSLRSAIKSWQAGKGK